VTVAEGQQVGNYRVLSRIGTGGMGAVYLAEHPVSGKKVALKVIHRELAGNREVISRFYQEARAVTRIGNEHIVEIHDFGQSAEGDHFFIMEFLEGHTLAQLIARERVMDIGRALHICTQIADALCAAHAAGIIHRDLKPDNVMLCNRHGDPAFVKLLDFGLAKMYDGGARNLTAAGVVLGTPQYMSPEACESRKDIDHRTDIYALGVLLFQMVTGQVPFDGQTMGEVLIKQVMHAPPAPRALNPHIPPSVEQLILRCLAKERDARFPTMLALREALFDPDRYLATSPPMMPAAMPSAQAQAMSHFGVNNAQPAMAHAATAAHPQLALKPPISEQKTMMHDGGLGSAATAAFDVGQVTHQAPMPPPGPMSAQHAAQGGPGTRRMTAVPQQPQNQTMVIATPHGFKSHPPRRGAAWVIIGVAVVGVVAGVALVLTMSGGEGKAREAAASPLDAAVTAAAPADAASVAVDAPPVPVKLARITITSDPSGAEVFDASGNRLGATPAEVGLPADGSEHTFTLKHPRARERTKTITATGDTTVEIILEKLPRRSGSSRGERDKASGDDVDDDKIDGAEIMAPDSLR
jgi:serine/threonine-protein kinase